VNGRTSPPCPRNQPRGLHEGGATIKTRDGARPKPDLFAVLLADPERKLQALHDDRDRVLARTDYLDRRAATFRFDRRLDDGMSDEVRHWIKQRLTRIRELCVAVRARAKTGHWLEARRAYERAERLAVDVNQGIALGRADAAAGRAARQRTRAGREGGNAAHQAALRLGERPNGRDGSSRLIGGCSRKRRRRARLAGPRQLS
jgi:hypothetical protein